MNMKRGKELILVGTAVCAMQDSVDPVQDTELSPILPSAFIETSVDHDEDDSQPPRVVFGSGTPIVAEGTLGEAVGRVT